MSGRFLFVGERRSPRAISMGVRWEDGHLAARTLHAALSVAGVALSDCRFINLFDDSTGALDQQNVAAIHSALAAGMQVIALGRLVQNSLRQLGIPHVEMVHPAARGAIRARERYQAHVADVLQGVPA